LGDFLSAGCGKRALRKLEYRVRYKREKKAVAREREDKRKR
jgi:hypothetical protein